MAEELQTYLLEHFQWLHRNDGLSTISGSEF